MLLLVKLGLRSIWITTDSRCIGGQPGAVKLVAGAILFIGIDVAYTSEAY
jgi:hypothetical protein